MIPRFLIRRSIISKSGVSLVVSVANFSSQSADFGFQDVPKQEKETLVKEVFSKVARKYDIMNDFMSVGAHRLWKDELIRMLRIPSAAFCEPNRLPRHLDVAGGTGDIAFRVVSELSSSYRPIISKYLSNAEFPPESERPVVICDINPEMLAVGRKRAQSKIGINEKMVGFIEGNAEKLPFPDNSFDIYTIAFGLRNVTNKEVALAEAYRVLQPGGRMCVLEFSTVTNPLLRQVYDQYSFNVIPKIGKYVADDEESYRYLVESIRRFP
eukprot:gene8746-18087_t